MDAQAASITTQQRNAAESKVLLKGVSWDALEQILRETGPQRESRLTYDQGSLELMIPYADHENPKALIESLIELIAGYFGLEHRSLGSPLIKRPDLGLAIEPDACFYFQTAAQFRGRPIDWDTAPPPDLCLEINYTMRSLGRFPVYSALGVPEFWRYEKQTLQVHQLQAGEYQLCDHSRLLPSLQVGKFSEFVRQNESTNLKEAMRTFQDQIQAFV